jgi:hypothetical protein
MVADNEGRMRTYAMEGKGMKELPACYLENVALGCNAVMMMDLNPDFTAFLAETRAVMLEELRKRGEVLRQNAQKPAESQF